MMIGHTGLLMSRRMHKLAGQQYPPCPYSPEQPLDSFRLMPSSLFSEYEYGAKACERSLVLDNANRGAGCRLTRCMRQCKWVLSTLRVDTRVTETMLSSVY